MVLRFVSLAYCVTMFIKFSQERGNYGSTTSSVVVGVSGVL